MVVKSTGVVVVFRLLGTTSFYSLTFDVICTSVCVLLSRNRCPVQKRGFQKRLIKATIAIRWKCVQ